VPRLAIRSPYYGQLVAITASAEAAHLQKGQPSLLSTSIRQALSDQSCDALIVAPSVGSTNAASVSVAALTFERYSALFLQLGDNKALYIRQHVHARLAARFSGVSRRCRATLAALTLKRFNL
jgi:hypothetical protein